LNTTKPKIGLFAGGIKTYWKDTGMLQLPAALEEDISRLRARLEEFCEVVYPHLCTDEDDSAQAARLMRDAKVDLTVMYHSTYLDDAMSCAFLTELGTTYSVLLHSQGLPDLDGNPSAIDWGRCWGVNSAVQLPGSLKRLWPGFRFGYVFGHLDNPQTIRELAQYARAAHAVNNLKGSKIAFLPHRSASVPMYDTFPDEARMIGQTGIKLRFLYIADLIKHMTEVSSEEAEKLGDEMYDRYEVAEPPREEVIQSCRVAIALERLVLSAGVDALAIDMFPGLTPHCGALPAVGMARLIDRGIVVTTEGDLSTAVTGLILKDLAKKPVHFWENLAFDNARNWVFGGHEGGSAGFTMAKKGTVPRLRNTQYVDFRGTHGKPDLGVLPEFITNPGPVTLLTLYHAGQDYEFRIACGESVDTPPRDVHFEHTIFKPRIPLREYFRRMWQHGTCHHFALTHQDVEGEVLKAAEVLNIKIVDLTARSNEQL